ncbi:MAG: carbohydrate ABC transporter permease [Anaerolineae bacterium]
MASTASGTTDSGRERPSGPTRVSARRPWHSRRFRTDVVRYGATAIAILGTLMILLPIVWMASTSLKTKFEAISLPPDLWPKVPQWHNYRDALTFNRFDLYFRNTTYYTVAATFGQVLSSSLVAYGFARLRARGRNALFLLVLATMMLPFEVTVIPQYVMFASFDWLDSYKPLIVPAFFGSAYSIFLMRQFYAGIPREMDEAAIIDGCGFLAIWYRIILPLSKPAIGAIAILSFMWRWNEYMGPLIYINSNDKYPLSLGLKMFRAPEEGTPFHWLMAASLVTVLPVIVVFFATQRYFVQGIVISGVKG